MGSLTIYYDGSRWVGFFVREEEDGDWGALHVFGAEPGGAEILDFLTNHYDELKFLPLDSEELPRCGAGGSYKSSLKKARREMERVPGGKSRRAYGMAQQRRLEEKKAARSRKRENDREEAYRRRREKKKRKKRGR